MLVAAARALATLSAGYVLAWGAWWTLLCAVALPRPRRVTPAPARDWRFVTIIPAHNEAASIGACLRSLAEAGARIAPPPELLLVADNCTDDTAARARAAGATVLERTDAARRGKPFALELALAGLAARAAPPDAVAFVDADSAVSPTFFGALAACLDAGASAAQVHYEAIDAATPLTRLRRLAFFLVHWSRPLGAARLGLGSGMKGNGMALRWDVAREGLGGGGIAEDAALTLALAERGIAVAFVPHASVHGQMAAGFAGARTQDERWERGRLGLMGHALLAALRAVRRGRADCAAAALELAAPPLSLLALLAVANAFAGVLLRGTVLRLAVAGVAALVAYVGVGLAAAPARRQDLAALVHAPRFVAYKLGVLARVASGRVATDWRRTERD